MPKSEPNVTTNEALVEQLPRVLSVEVLSNLSLNQLLELAEDPTISPDIFDPTIWKLKAKQHLGLDLTSEDKPVGPKFYYTLFIKLYRERVRIIGLEGIQQKILAVVVDGDPADLQTLLSSLDPKVYVDNAINRNNLRQFLLKARELNAQTILNTFYNWIKTLPGTPLIPINSEPNLLYWAILCQQDKEIIVDFINLGLALDDNEQFFDKPFSHTGRTFLEFACHYGNLDAIKATKDKSPNTLRRNHPQAQNPPRTFISTLLHHATEGGHEKLVRYFLDLAKEGFVSIEDLDINSALAAAVRTNHITLAKLLIDTGKANMSFCPYLFGAARSNDHKTLLYEAVHQGLVDMALLLIERGAADKLYDHKDEPGYRHVIHLAATKGYQSIVEALLKRNPLLLNLTDEHGKTPLICATVAGNVDVIRTMLDIEPSLIDAPDNEGKTPLYIALENNQVHVAEELLRMGAVDRMDFSRTHQRPHAIYLAITKHYHTVVQGLLNTDPNLLDIKDQYGTTLLLHAIQCGQTIPLVHAKTIVSYLLQQTGIDLNARTEAMQDPRQNGRNALHWAIVEGVPRAEQRTKLKFIELLLQARIKMDVPAGISGDFPIHLAAGGCEALPDGQEDFSEEYVSEDFGLQVIQLLQEANPNSINSCSGEGYTPLFLAIANNRFRIAEDLCRRKNIDIDASLRTPGITREQVLLIKLVARIATIELPSYSLFYNPYKLQAARSLLKIISGEKSLYSLRESDRTCLTTDKELSKILQEWQSWQTQNIVGRRSHPS